MGYVPPPPRGSLPERATLRVWLLAWLPSATIVVLGFLWWYWMVSQLPAGLK